MHYGSLLHGVGERTAADIHVFIQCLLLSLFDQCLPVGGGFPGTGKKQGDSIFFYMNDQLIVCLHHSEPVV